MKVAFSSTKFNTGTLGFIEKNGIEYAVSKMTTLVGAGGYAWVVRVGEGDEEDQALLGEDGHLNTGETCYMKGTTPQAVTVKVFQNIYKNGEKYTAGTVLHSSKAIAEQKAANSHLPLVYVAEINFSDPAPTNN